MKKLLVASLGALPFVALAEGETGTEVATSTLTTLINQISSWFNTAWPVIFGIAGVLLVPWLIKTAISVIKSISAAFR